MSLKLWYNDSDWVIAETPEDAWAVLEEETGLTPVDFDLTEKRKEEGFWREWTRPLAMFDEDTPAADMPKKTPAEWIAEKGRGYLGSSDY